MSFVSFFFYNERSTLLSKSCLPLPPSSRVISKLFLRGFPGLRTTVSSGWAARRADFTSSALRPYTRQLLLPEVTHQDYIFLQILRVELHSEL